MKKPLAIGTGLVVGALGAAAFFLNPGSGKRRRNQAVSESKKVVRRSAHIAAMMGTMGKSATKSRQDEQIINRIESELVLALGNVGFTVAVEDETVIARGEVEQMSQIATVSSILREHGGGLEILNLVRLRKSA